MPSISSLFSVHSYHILAYGTLLGCSVYQTFVGGPLASKVLPRASFSVLQQATFTSYFSLQASLAIFLALSWPGERVIEAADNGGLVRENVGWSGLLEADHFYTAFVPITIMIVTSLLNLLILGPATLKVMQNRKHQETGDAQRDPGSHLLENQQLQSSFSKVHRASSVSNLIGIFSMLYYGLVLAEKQ